MELQSEEQSEQRRRKRPWLPESIVVNAQTHPEQTWAYALRDHFFVKWSHWPTIGRLPNKDIRELLERYFEGLDVKIEQVDHNPPGWSGFRIGFDVTLNSLPKMKIVFCGQDRDEIPANHQVIGVQVDDVHLHAEAGFYGDAAQALAAGFNVFVREWLDLEERRRGAADDD